VSLEPLITATPLIKAHVALAIAALVPGAAIFSTRKGTRLHRALGRGAGLALVLTALTSFGIGRDWSVIHLLSVVALVSVAVGVIAIRAGRTGLHARAMRGAMFGLTVAGLFTLLPHRIIGRMFFSG